MRIKLGDEKGIGNLSQYIIRNAFSLAKFQYDEGASSAIYVSKMSHGKNKKNIQIFSPFEFIAAITQHIPEQSFQLVRYYGWYSNRMRGDRKKQEGGEEESEDKSLEKSKIIDLRKYKPKRMPQLMWRECIKKIWEVDPLTCPKCTGEMRIISFIYKRTVFKKILIHLNLYEEKGNQRAPPIAKKDYTKRVEIVPCDDGWPGYEEMVVEFLKKTMNRQGMGSSKLRLNGVGMTCFSLDLLGEFVMAVISMKKPANRR